MLRGLKVLGIKAELPERVKVLSFLATPGGVKPVTPAKRRGRDGARPAIAVYAPDWSTFEELRACANHVRCCRPPPSPQT